MTMESNPAATAKKKSGPQRNLNVAPAISPEDRTFASRALGRQVTYRVVLPAEYHSTGHRYPVLFLLHGVFGGFENWETLTDVARYSAGAEVIIVTPDAGNSWYVNSATDPNQRYEDFIIQDLISEVDATYRTLRSSHRRAIAGLSMGGYGALKFAIKYPGTFDFAGSISGAFNGTFDLDAHRADLRDDLLKAFGPAGSPTRKENDIFELVRSADVEQLPYFYLDCGTEDEFCDVNRRLTSALRERGAPYEYHEVPGGHSWRYWDQRISALLPIVSKMITAA
jgi:putative tributyrin esterase